MSRVEFAIMCPERNMKRCVYSVVIFRLIINLLRIQERESIHTSACKEKFGVSMMYLESVLFNCCWSSFFVMSSQMKIKKEIKKKIVV